MNEKEIKLKQIAIEFEAVCAELYSEGITLDVYDDRRPQYRKERDLMRNYRRALYEVFGARSSIQEVYDGMDRIHPGLIYIPVLINQDVAIAREEKLPYAEEKPDLPFSAKSPTRASVVSHFHDEQYCPQLQDVIITTDHKNGAYNFCFTAIPGTVGANAINGIEYMATQVYKELGNQVRGKPVNFYIHIPSEILNRQEMFMKVEMKFDPMTRRFTAPQFQHLKTLPAGLDKSLLRHLERPYVGQDRESYTDPNGRRHIHRDYALKEFEQGLTF